MAVTNQYVKTVSDLSAEKSVLEYLGAVDHGYRRDYRRS